MNAEDLHPIYHKHARSLRRGKGILRGLPAEYHVPDICPGKEECEHHGTAHQHLVDHGRHGEPRHFVHRPGRDRDEFRLCPGCRRLPHWVIHFHDAYLNTVTLGAVHHDLTGAPHPFWV